MTGALLAALAYTACIHVRLYGVRRELRHAQAAISQQLALSEEHLASLTQIRANLQGLSTDLAQIGIGDGVDHFQMPPGMPRILSTPFAHGTIPGPAQ